MKRIGVVIRDASEVDKVNRALADAGIPILSAIREQQDYLSVRVEEGYLESALHVIRRAGFDAAEIQADPKQG
jgi:hypothetical protein